MINEALSKLRPNAKWILHGDSIQDLEWFDTEQTRPTDDELKQEVYNQIQEYKSKQYARNRAREYPPLTELADALYHQQNGDDTKMTAYLAKCEAVKQKYPKE